MAAKQGEDDSSLKSIYRPENQAFLSTLRGLRTKANLTQADLAQRLGRSQNFVTAAERGVTRLDGLQLRDWCVACGVDLVTWAKAVEKALKSTPSKG